jgi:hypothetical protein
MSTDISKYIKNNKDSESNGEMEIIEPKKKTI